MVTTVFVKSYRDAPSISYLATNLVCVLFAPPSIATYFSFLKGLVYFFLNNIVVIALARIAWLTIKIVSVDNEGCD